MALRTSAGLGRIFQFMLFLLLVPFLISVVTRGVVSYAQAVAAMAAIHFGLIHCLNLWGCVYAESR